MPSFPGPQDVMVVTGSTEQGLLSLAMRKTEAGNVEYETLTLQVGQLFDRDELNPDQFMILERLEQKLRASRPDLGRNQLHHISGDVEQVDLYIRWGHSEPQSRNVGVVKGFGTLSWIDDGTRANRIMVLESDESSGRIMICPGRDMILNVSAESLQEWWNPQRENFSGPSKDQSSGRE